MKLEARLAQEEKKHLELQRRAQVLESWQEEVRWEEYAEALYSKWQKRLFTPTALPVLEQEAIVREHFFTETTRELNQFKRAYLREAGPGRRLENRRAVRSETNIAKEVDEMMEVDSYDASGQGCLVLLMGAGVGAGAGYAIDSLAGTNGYTALGGFVGLIGAPYWATLLNAHVSGLLGTKSTEYRRTEALFESNIHPRIAQTQHAVLDRICAEYRQAHAGLLQSD
jgi:hypothetical protein